MYKTMARPSTMATLAVQRLVAISDHPEKQGLSGNASVLGARQTSALWLHGIDRQGRRNELRCALSDLATRC
jgi:hypothetical protein